MPLRVKNFTTDTCNGYWTSMAFTTIPPEGNPKLKELTYKYMTAHNTLKYLDALPELVARYNQCIHSSINMAPANVNRHNEEVIWQRLFKPTVPLNPYQFRLGDFVRTSKLLGKEEARRFRNRAPRACGRKACTG